MSTFSDSRMCTDHNPEGAELTTLMAPRITVNGSCKSGTLPRQQSLMDLSRLHLRAPLELFHALVKMLKLSIQSIPQFLHGGGGQVRVQLPEVLPYGRSFSGAEPCPLCIPSPQLLGPPCEGVLIRENLGQRRFRTRLSIGVLWVHA